MLVNAATGARTPVLAPFFRVGRRLPSPAPPPGAFLLLEHPAASRVQCALVRSGPAGPVILVDLSRAGTFVDGARVPPRQDPPLDAAAAAALEALEKEAGGGGGGRRWAPLQGRVRIRMGAAAECPTFTVDLGGAGSAPAPR